MSALLPTIFQVSHLQLQAWIAPLLKEPISGEASELEGNEPRPLIAVSGSERACTIRNAEGLRSPAADGAGHDPQGPRACLRRRSSGN